MHRIEIHAADMYPHELALIRLARIGEGRFDRELIAILGLAEGVNEFGEALLGLDHRGGHARIILVDLTNGHQADVLNGFDAASIGPVSPSITPDGTGVLIGSSNGTGPVLIDVSSFPSGPFPHTDIAGASHPVEPVAAGSARGSVFAFVSSSGSGPIEYGRIGGSTLKQVPATSQLSLNPAIGSPGGTQTILFNAANPFGTADISFCAPISPTSNCQVASLPGVVNSNAGETRPAFTPDGRYVGFLRTVAGHQRVFVWDSDTQTLLDNSGADLGGGPTGPIFSNLSLYEKFVFHGVSLSPRGSVQFDLTLPSLVGIIVQRVEGHQRLFGRTVPRLGPLRRVPLGSFRRGHGHAHWNLRVDGKPLRPGTYQVTVRALTRAQKVRDLSKPRLLRIRGGA